MTARARTIAGASAAVAALALVVVATRSGQTRDVSSRHVSYHPHKPIVPKVHDRAEQQIRQGLPTHQHPGGGWLGVLLTCVVALAVAVAAVAVIAYLVRLIREYEREPNEPKRPDEHGDWAEAPPDVSGALAEVVDEVLVTIERGSTRDAIIACWLRLEDVAAAAGVGRRPAETAEELTARVLAAYRVDPATLARLADLYREARFSDHALGESERAEARSSLARIRSELVPA